MNTECPVVADVMQSNEQKPKRGWFRRNWLWFIPTLLLVMILLCGGCLGGLGYWGFNKIYDELHNMEMFKTAMQKIEASPEVQQAIGKPMTIVRWPPGPFQIETSNGEGNAEIRWEVEGPKGRVKAHIRGRRTSGHWDIVILEATLPDGKRISFDVLDGGNVAPPYQQPKTGGKPESKGPPPEVDLDIPMPDAKPAGK